MIELLKGLERVVREATDILCGTRVPWEDVSDSDDGDATELQQLVPNMAETITRMMRLSMVVVVRNPAPHDRLKEPTTIDTSYYELHDVRHVRDKFPLAKEYLSLRLGKAISLEESILGTAKIIERSSSKITRAKRAITTTIAP